MRVKPAPGHYRVEVEGATHIVEITEDGAISHVVHMGVPYAFEWEWFELPSGGPALLPKNGLACQFVGFNEDGTLDVVFPDDSGKSGTYGPA